jgi:hypothetical protein
MPEKKPKRKVYEPKKSPLEGLAKLAKDDPFMFLPRELAEAQVLEKTDPAKAQEIRDAYWTKFRKEKEERDADERAKKNRTGKYDPINFPLGTCRVCNEESIVAKDKWVSTGEMRIGGPSNQFRAHDCFYCKSCGIKYQFVPKDKE